VNVLLDTHAFLWAVTGDRRLSSPARALIEDGENQVFLSAVSMWEIVLKAKAGKLHVEGSVAKVLEEQMRQARISPLPIYPAHVLRVAALPPIHKDPFDRLLIAQAQAENLALVTRDPEIRRYAVQVIW
jgi:PIN domain nuclease of toxin-antitoxin system